MGPLQGYRIIEIAGIGPAPYCGMLLADMGAELIRIERIEDSDLGVQIPDRFNVVHRSRPGIRVDLKQPAGVNLVLDLCQHADALFEGQRPGVMERLGLGPERCQQRNQKLVYGRMTGWGQDGPLSATAGHDPNYIALSGALHSIGEANRLPVMPLNLVGDYGGGGAFLAIGILAALLETAKSGKGQVIDAAMTDGAASLMTLFYGLLAAGLWRDKRGSNLLDGGAPFARCYACADEHAVVVCAIERKFFTELLSILEIDDIEPAAQFERDEWPRHAERIASAFSRKSRADWINAFAGSDACFAPVLNLNDAVSHPHNVARGTFVDVAGVVQPGPAPRFSRTVSTVGCTPDAPVDVASLLRRWGIAEARIDDCIAHNALLAPPAP